MAPWGQRMAAWKVGCWSVVAWGGVWVRTVPSFSRATGPCQVETGTGRAALAEARAARMAACSTVPMGPTKTRRRTGRGRRRSTVVARLAGVVAGRAFLAVVLRAGRAVFFGVGLAGVCLRVRVAMVGLRPVLWLGGAPSWVGGVGEKCNSGEAEGEGDAVWPGHRFFSVRAALTWMAWR